ncbi:MAG: aliphatic sulfonate transporter, substrate-binding protein [Pseudomonadota bacterium]
MEIVSAIPSPSRVSSFTGSLHRQSGLRAAACASLRGLCWAVALTGWLACRAEPPRESAPAATLEPPAAAKEPRVVRLGYQKIGTPFLLRARAEPLQKRLSELNAKVEWVEFAAGPPLLEAMRARAVDIGYAGETPPVFAQAGGVQFVYVAADPPAPEAEAIVVPAKSTIQKLTELKGKRIALNRGSNVHYLLLRALESAQLKLSDVTVVYLAPADARSAFESGQVDAWVIWDPFLAAAERAGARVLKDGRELVDNHLYYVVERSFAEQSPAIVTAVLEQYRELSEWAKGHDEEAARILADSSGIAYEALLLAERRHTYGIVPITPEILRKQQNIADSFYKLELIPKAIRIEEAFLPAAAYTASR